MPGHDHGSSIKAPRVYEALRRKGMGKSKAARISNATRSGGSSKGGKSKGGRRR
jgi:hypothetical protein